MRHVSDLETPVQVTAPQPAPPERQFSFTDFQVNNPSAPPPGDRLDAEIDRSNGAIEDVILWASVSLNSDGSLKPQSIGKTELAPGLLDGLADAELARLQPLIDNAKAAAEMAVSLANEADASALAADARAKWAADSGSRAASDAEDAANSAAEAAQSALEAEASATAAADSANHADGSEASAEAWSWVSVEWAEHMPDTIPPQILATNGITGEHWSSRWWAHRAHELALEGGQEVICQIEHYWLGAHPQPPTQDSCGQPITAGAMFFNISLGRVQVYDGYVWHDVVQPVPGTVDEYIFMPASPTLVFTGADINGKIVTIDVTASKVGVFLNGVRLLEGIDYQIGANTVTMLTGAIEPPNVIDIVVFNQLAAADTQPIGVKINTSIWAFDGIARTFPLHDATGAVINPPSAVDCIVSLNGVVQEGGVDYTVRPGFIDFSTPPEADADRWMTAGIPMGGGGTASMLPPAVPATSGLLVPYYLPPNDPYADVNTQRLLGLMRQYHDVPTLVVLNPANGPGSAADANYQNFIKLLRAAGGKVLGYVATGYGTRPETEVQADINLWRTLYAAPSVDGIFIDEMPWDLGPGGTGTDWVQLYQRYNAYCHSFGYYPVVANPGTNQRPEWFATPTADIIIVHEDATWPTEASMMGNYVGGHADYSYTKRAALVYNQPTLSTPNLNTLRKYTQWVYVTDDNLTAGALNPWDALPTYLESLFAGLSEGGAAQARIDALEARLAALEAAP